MKLQLLLVPVGLMLIAVTSSAQKNELIYPEDSITAESKKAFDKTFKQGKILYGIACGSCHNFKEKNKEIVPDFSIPQLMDYEMRTQYPKHMDKLDDKHVTDDEMSKIILFLRFKKKSGREFPVRNN
jgi:hypothetical protein